MSGPGKKSGRAFVYQKITDMEVNGDNSQGTALGQQGPAPNLQQVQPAVLQQVSSAPAQPTAPTGQPLAQPVQQTTAPIPLTAQQVQPTAIPGQQTMGPSTGGINTASAFLGQAAASAPQISQAQAVGGFPLSQSAGMMYAVVNQPLQMGVSMQNIPLKSQTITVPDQHGIQRQHLVNEYQVHAVWSISTGQAMTQDPPSVTPPQPSLGSLPSASSTQSSVSSFMSQTTQAMGQSANPTAQLQHLLMMIQQSNSLQDLMVLRQQVDDTIKQICQGVSPSPEFETTEIQLDVDDDIVFDDCTEINLESHVSSQVCETSSTVFVSKKSFTKPKMGILRKFNSAIFRFVKSKL